MKRVLIALIVISNLCAGCGQQKQEVEHQRYTAYGRYYTNGTVITEDGNIWGYSTDIISNKPVYNNEPVWIAFDDNGTPDNIYDDAIIGLVYDRMTAIYDALETELNNDFDIERKDNIIHIKGIAQ